jgi:DNA-directed RNA polymerase specialized sigma24 family protein
LDAGAAVALIAVELTETDLNEVVKKLTIYAYALVPRYGVVEGVGDGPDDLVVETLRRWWDPATKLKWNTDRGASNLGGIIAFLKKAMKNLFLDRKKTAGHKRHAVMAEETDDAVPNAPVAAGANSPDGLFARAYLGELVERVLALAEAADDVEVTCYVELQTQEGGPYKNQEAAERLGIEPSDVVNLRKRLDRYTLKAREGAVTQPMKAKR